jgi:hypothetical protein
MAEPIEMLFSGTLLLTGFVCGYGIREWLSRRRRAAVLAEYYKRHPEERP